MTCFSIQKSSLFCLALTVFLLFGPVLAMAQEFRNPDGSRLTADQVQEKNRTDAPILVELFTASDCSACVLADRMLYDIMKDKNVIALSCHIKDMREALKDGETDQQGKDSGEIIPGPMDPCVFRHWTYKSRGKSRDVTMNIPEFIIQGYEKIGIDGFSVFQKMVGGYHFQPRNTALEILGQWKDADTISINLPERIIKEGSKTQQNTASVWIIRYKDMAVEKIDIGVNKGKVLRFSNIIQDIRHVGKWHGKMRTIDVDVPKPQGGKERGGYAFIVQEVMGAPILAAGKLEDYPLPNDLKRTIEPETQNPLTIDRPDSTPAPTTNR